MLVIHPIVQCSAIALAMYVFWLGLQRVRSVYLGQETVFVWKRHVVIGKIALGTLLFGVLLGATMVYVYWRGILITGAHGRVALAMVPFIVFGVGSGLYMDIRRHKTRFLPLVHGINNLTVLVMALTQVLSGWLVYKGFVLGE